MTKIGIAAGAALFACAVAAAAQATTLSSAPCSTGSLTLGGANAAACAGIFEGNDANQSLDGLFGVSGWSEIVKLDMPDRRRGASNALSATANGVTLTIDGEGRSGGWAVDSFGVFETIMVVLKGGPTFSAYLVSREAGLSGFWNMLSLQRGNGRAGPDLSHFTLYGQGTATRVAGVPLPAALPLLGSGLAGLAFAARRRKTKASPEIR